MSRVPFHYCEICGNLTGLIKNGGGELVCCGQPMTLLDAKTAEEGLEKHVPVVRDLGDKIEIIVGDVMHPMTPEHRIEWIAVVGEKSTTRVLLTDTPSAVFDKVPGGVVYAYCNLHGLWKADL